MDELSVECVESERGLVVKVCGEADLPGSARLERELLRVMAHQAGVVVIDLTGLTFISSLAMGCLVAFHRGVAIKGGQVRFSGLKDPVEVAFQRAQLDRIFILRGTVDEALADVETNVGSANVP